MKKQWILCLLMAFIGHSTLIMAVRPANTLPVETLKDTETPSTQKAIKQQQQLNKKIQKLERKVAKKMEKAEQQKRSILDEPMFRLGLLCILGAIACGLLVGLGVLGSLFSLIGGLLLAGGIILLILGLLGY